MLRSILVGVDGSEYSTAAVELGIQWVQRSGAVLVGLGIIDAPTISRPEPIPLGKRLQGSVMPVYHGRPPQGRAVLGALCAALCRGRCRLPDPPGYWSPRLNKFCWRLSAMTSSCSGSTPFSL